MYTLCVRMNPVFFLHLVVKNLLLLLVDGSTSKGLIKWRLDIKSQSQKPALILRQRLWERHLVLHKHISKITPGALDRHTLPLQSLHESKWCNLLTAGQLDSPAIQMLNLDVKAQKCLLEADGDISIQSVLASLKGGVRAGTNFKDNISGVDLGTFVSFPVKDDG